MTERREQMKRVRLFFQNSRKGRALVGFFSVCSALLACGCVVLATMAGGESLSTFFSRISVAFYLPPAPGAEGESSTPSEENSLFDPQQEVFPQASPSPEPSASSSPLPESSPDPDRDVQSIEETQITGSEVDGFRILDRSGTSGLDYQAEADAYKADVPRDGTPVILIYHTHTTECYQMTANSWCYKDAANRSDNPEETVVAVGDVIAEKLEEAGYGVVHDTTVHDSPAYTGSYDRSAETIRKNLEKYPTICITLDVHRDALEDSDGNLLKTVAEVDGEKAAQFMIICGCGEDESLGFPNWKENFRFGLRLQENADEMYPGLSRPLYFLERVYNENFTPGSLLVEFGTSGNNIQEACRTGELFAEILIETLAGA